VPVSRKRKKKPSPLRRKQKPGDAYQDAVAQVARSIDPTAEVAVGTWTNGPDGRRDLDVVIRLKGASAPLAVIECKDWNRPIGIGLIDALESKRRDIGASAVMICSNSGYTADALRKAARVGIPALAALIEGDNRIRVVVKEQIYTRMVEFIHHGPNLHHQELNEAQKAALAGAFTKEFTYAGKSLEPWVSGRLLNVASVATRPKSFQTKVGFREPIEIDVRGIKLCVSGIDIRAAFTVQWMTQVAEIGVSHGMYDYLRKVLVIGPGPHQFHLKNVNSETWGEPIAIEDVPPRLLIPLDQRTVVGIMELAMIKNIPQADPKDAPDLQGYIATEEIVNEGES